MTADGISRRGILGGAAGLVAAAEATAQRRMSDNPARLTLLTSTDGVHTPPQGGSVMKFSFSDPDPSVAFAGLMFGFQIITFENSYAIDPATVLVTRTGDRLRLVATGLTCAGGTLRKEGRLTAELEKTATGAIEWRVSTRLQMPVKAVKTIVRGLPRGRLSPSAEGWRDTGENETIHEYPSLMGGMATPFVAIEGRDGRFWGLSALQREVRPARFAFLPGPEGYKAELIYEQAGWDRRGDVETCRWRIAVAPDLAGVAAPHFAAVAQAYAIPDVATRTDMPAWARDVTLVLSIHGEHWTGYLFNSFARQLEILRWVARQIDPRQVMVFLPGWDGRYYWDYPAFRVGERPGGEAAFRRLIVEGRKLGFRFCLMFGSNIANPARPEFAALADAQVRTVYGTPYASDYVDWDGDRKGEPSMVFMNLAVDSWRTHLAGRIDDMLSRYPLDAYFLDICGLWENNPDGDMMLGTRMLVRDLARKHPGVMPVAEMQYDAQMGFIPMNHAARYGLYPQANDDVVASFNHLSWPAPGRGSSGVHENGFGRYRPVAADQRTIPTITFVDDTFDRNRELVMKDIATAKRWRAAKRR